jgi:hypothetical protein
MSSATGEQRSEFVYVNQDGSARELSPDERIYLSSEFDLFDSGAPYLKARYESRDVCGSQSGFMLRRLVPDQSAIASTLYGR